LENSKLSGKHSNQHYMVE